MSPLEKNPGYGAGFLPVCRGKVAPKCLGGGLQNGVQYGMGQQPEGGIGRSKRFISFRQAAVSASFSERPTQWFLLEECYSCNWRKSLDFKMYSAFFPVFLVHHILQPLKQPRYQTFSFQNYHPQNPNTRSVYQLISMLKIQSTPYKLKGLSKYKLISLFRHEGLKPGEDDSIFISGFQ